MRRAGVVALNTFREAVRDRVLYNLVFFALLMMAAAVAVGQISIGIEETVIVSLGLSAISVIGLLISIFLGVALGGSVFHPAEARADRRAGASVFLLYDAAAGDLVHGGLVHRGFVRAGAEEFAGRSDESGDGCLHEMAVLSAAEF